MKKTKWIGGGILLLLLIFAAAAGFYKWKEHHEAKPEISYTVTSKEHIADKDSGMKYVNNELLVTVKEGVKKEQIEKLAEKYHASVGGYIEVSGNSQWIFDENYTDEELEKIAKKIEKEEAVSSAVLNNVLEIQTQEAKPWLPYSPEWDNQKWDDNAPAGDNYYLEVIRADEAWKELSEIKNVENQAVNIGLIDTLFDADAKKEQCKKEDPDSRLYYTKEDNSYAGNPDLPFVKTFYNPSKSVTEAEVTDEEFKSHGSQVAAVMAATFDRQKKTVSELQAYIRMETGIYMARLIRLSKWKQAAYRLIFR